MVTLVDVTNLGRAEEHQKVLIAELNHRVKNMLAVVISIANATLRTPVSGSLHRDPDRSPARDGAGLQPAVERELVGGALSDLVSVEAQAHGARKIAVEGPAVRLRPPQALALGMVLHELATNATKYGALSSERGQVSVTWAVDTGQVRVDWRERDGPSSTFRRNGTASASF